MRPTRLVPLAAVGALATLMVVAPRPEPTQPLFGPRAHEAHGAPLPTLHADAPAAPRLAGLPARPARTAPSQVAEKPAPKRMRERDDPVLRGLRWLAAHQVPDGSWNPAEAPSWCDGKPQAPDADVALGLREHEVGATGLALLAYLALGYTHRGDHEFARVVKQGTLWLKTHAQQRDGTLMTVRHTAWLWDHAVATLALLEHYGMTESHLWREPALQALQALLRQRDVATGTWTFGTGRPSDVATATCWATLPLLTAYLIRDDAARRERELPLVPVEDALYGVRAWLDGQLHPDRRAELAALDDDVAPGSAGRALTTFALALRLLLCTPADAGVTLPPVWDVYNAESRVAPLVEAWVGGPGAAASVGKPGATDLVHAWMGGTIADIVSGKLRAAWDADVERVLAADEIVAGEHCDVRGSWPARGEVGRRLGSVGATALAVLALNRPYRCYRPARPCLPAR